MAWVFSARGIVILTLVLDVIIISVSWFLQREPTPNPTAGASSTDNSVALVASGSLILVAFITLFGFFLASHVADQPIGQSLRNGIAAAFVVLYLALLPYILLLPNDFSSLFGGAAVPPDSVAAGARQAATEYAQGVLSGFTGFVTMILAFYFGAQVLDKVSGDILTYNIQKQRLASQEAMNVAQVNAGQTPTPLPSAEPTSTPGR